jgi:hypothetical protein
MTAGTRVRHADGATGTVTGSTRYLTGVVVTKVKWDDRSSSRIGDVEIIDEKAAVCRG